jgi:hypothetical protein
MSNIFISHASSNLQDAIGIKRHLLDLGFTVWMAAEDIQAGVNYAEEITKSISKADAVIVLLSPESIASPHVKREVNLTIDGQKFLIPVLLGVQKDFVSTLPEDWKYWLTVVQIINFKDGTTTAMEISDVLNQKLKSSAVRKPQAERVGLLGKLTNLSTSGKALLALTMAVVIVAIVSFSGSPSSENIIAGETQAPVDTTIVSKVIVAKESMMATDFSNELPGFPTAIVDYELSEVIKSADFWQLRLYGEDWQTPDYFEAGTQMNSCNDGFWVIRWRSESGSEIKSAGGYIDNQINVFTDETAQGGAGYMSGFICEAPFFISANAPTNILEDINYELQIWTYKPGI